MTTKKMKPEASQDSEIETNGNQTPGKKPITVFKSGLLQAAIFRDFFDDHAQRVTYSITLTKRYHQDGRWKTAKSSLFPGDLPSAIRCLTRAMEYLEELEQRKNDNPTTDS